MNTEEIDQIIKNIISSTGWRFELLENIYDDMRSAIFEGKVDKFYKFVAKKLKKILVETIDFKINEYITLRYEEFQTNIYVNNKIFRQCKYLLLNIPTSEIHDYNEIDSIDKFETVENRVLEQDSSISDFNITPKEEFQGHCSNIQAWVENDYNTQILHRSLAFPLLRALTDAGDVFAKIK